MSTTRILGAMRSYNDLVDIVRARIAELGITYAAADDLAGLQDGYTAKLLSPTPIRRMTPWTLFLIFDGLGLAAQVTENAETMARIADRVARGRSRAPQKRTMPGLPSIVEWTPDLLRIAGRKGAFARNQKLSAKRRAKIARRAARARWRKARRQAIAQPAAAPAPGRSQSVSGDEPKARALPPSVATMA